MIECPDVLDKFTMMLFLQRAAHSGDDEGTHESNDEESDEEGKELVWYRLWMIVFYSLYSKFQWKLNMGEK